MSEKNLIDMWHAIGCPSYYLLKELFKANRKGVVPVLWHMRFSLFGALTHGFLSGRG